MGYLGLPQRFWEKVLAPSSAGGCWLWIARSKSPFGYGRMKWNGRMKVVHRLTYEAAVGLVPPGLVLDHLCRIPACCNPELLGAVTPKENVNRSNQAKVVSEMMTRYWAAYRKDKLSAVRHG